MELDQNEFCSSEVKRLSLLAIAKLAALATISVVVSNGGIFLSEREKHQWELTLSVPNLILAESATPSARCKFVAT